MNGYLDDVTASFHRCRRDESFVDTFYETFLGKSPEVAEMFASTDFKIQKLMLRESLLSMLCFNLHMAGTRDEIVRLGKRHRELGVRPEHYDLWLDALCETIAKRDAEYSPDLEQKWREAMQTGIEVMLSEAR